MIYPAPKLRKDTFSSLIDSKGSFVDSGLNLPGRKFRKSTFEGFRNKANKQ